MNELDEAWSQMLAGAIENAKVTGRGDVADFLALKQSNDALRQTAIDWLFNSFIEIAAEANRRNSSVQIEREEPHEFQFNKATMAGSLVRIRFGVRSMLVEAGWTRLPSHGFMRGGALAAARIKHFGMPKADAELVLVREAETPAWNHVDGGRFDSQNLFQHFRVLLGS
jgi:hypothetical protein